MRRSTGRYESVMATYEKMLDGRVQRGEIKPQTKEAAMNHANQLFEACLRSLTLEALEEMAKAWFPGFAYTKGIRDLKQLVAQRDRKVRTVSS